MTANQTIRLMATGPYDKQDVAALRDMVNGPGWQIFVNKCVAQRAALAVDIGMDITAQKDRRDAAVGEYRLLLAEARLHVEIEEAIEAAQAETQGE
jgi:hypothetical protein